MTDAAIRLEGIRKRFGALEVLKGVDLEVATGEVVAIVGPSGSGKTTLLRTINVLEPPDDGRLSVCSLCVQFGGDRSVRQNASVIRSIRRRTAMVFQNFHLFPHMTALGNVAEGLISVRGLRREEAQRQGRDLLARMALADKADVYPQALSGGQKQRVAIARGLAMKPDVMLFDEPTSALDPELRSEVREVIREIAQSAMTMLIVTHEMQFARTIADRIVFMEDGVIVSDSPPAAFFGGANGRIKRFLEAGLSQ